MIGLSGQLSIGFHSLIKYRILCILIIAFYCLIRNNWSIMNFAYGYCFHSLFKIRLFVLWALMLYLITTKTNYVNYFVDSLRKALKTLGYSCNLNILRLFWWMLGIFWYFVYRRQGCSGDLQQNQGYIGVCPTY